MFTLQTNLAHVFSVGLACCYLVRLDDWALPIALEMSRAPPLSFEIINCILYKTGGGGGLCVFIYLARRSGSERVTLWFRTSGLWCKRQVSLGSDFCQILNTIWSCGLGIWGGEIFFAWANLSTKLTAFEKKKYLLLLLWCFQSCLGLLIFTDSVPFFLSKIDSPARSTGIGWVPVFFREDNSLLIPELLLGRETNSVCSSSC